MLNTSAGASAWKVRRETVWTCTPAIARQQEADAGDDEYGQDVGGEDPEEELRGTRSRHARDHMR